MNKFSVLELDTHEDVLRKKSIPVPHSEIGSAEFNQFLVDLRTAMMAVKLEEGWMHAGISAVQVGVHKRVFMAYKNSREDYVVYINPEIEYLGDSADDKLESCLSIPDARGKVRRHKRIRIIYTDIHGNQQREKLSGWDARVIQHEYDHLEGILFTDKLLDE